MDVPATSSQPSTATLPFVLVAVLETGQTRVLSNLPPDLVTALCERAKLQVLLQPPDKPLIQKPGNDFAAEIMRKMRP